MIKKQTLRAARAIDIKTSKPLIAKIRSETNLLTSQTVKLFKELERKCPNKRKASHTIKCKDVPELLKTGLNLYQIFDHF